MRHLLVLFTIPVALLAASVPVRATCDSGFSIRLAGQLPDFTFTSGMPETVHFNPWYISFASIGGSCGIVARSTVPGVSIQQTYGCPGGGGCDILPAGQWAPVGDAYPNFFDRVSHKNTDIPILYDGTTPAGTYGTIEIGINGTDAGIGNVEVIGVANVYVEGPHPPATWFGVLAGTDNISADELILDHPYLNANPAANIFVSHVRNLGGSLFGSSWNHPVAVEYDEALQRWAIRNMDGAAMTSGLGFGVRFDPTGLLYCTPVFVGGSQIYVLHNNADNNPWATILVTPIGGGAHPVSVIYAAPYWRIVYSDGAAIPANTCFNVKVFAFTQYLDDPAWGDLSGVADTRVNWGTGVDAGGSGTGHTSGSARVLQFDWALEDPFRQMIVTSNQNPAGLTPFVDPRQFGFSAPRPFAVGGRWSVYHEDGSAMSSSARFNVWAPCAGGSWYPDGDGDGYGVEAVPQASCAPLPGYAARLGDCDDTDATRYPGSPEINDGRDNQCAGEPGYGLVDEIASGTVFYDPMTLCWPGQSWATLYQVARSTSGAFSTCTYLLPTSSTCLTESDLPAAGGAFFYLVRTETPWPGSWGVDSAGQERLLTCQ